MQLSSAGKNNKDSDVGDFMPAYDERNGPCEKEWKEQELCSAVELS
jgi:hypothetical protein